MWLNAKKKFKFEKKFSIAIIRSLVFTVGDKTFKHMLVLEFNY